MKNSKVLRVGIAGAGSAGPCGRNRFARAGHAVTVFEKHPSLAPLGAGLLIQPQGIRAIAELGVGAAFEKCSVPIKRLLGVSHRGWNVVDIRYDMEHARAGQPRQAGYGAL